MLDSTKSNLRKTSQLSSKMLENVVVRSILVHVFYSCLFSLCLFTSFFFCLLSLYIYILAGRCGEQGEERGDRKGGGGEVIRGEETRLKREEQRR